MKKYWVWLSIVALLVGTALLPLGSSAVQAAEGANLALGKANAASGHNDVYVAANAFDNDQNTYWESTNNAFPQWIQTDLGSKTSIDRVVLKLPAGWEPRTQTLSVQGSDDGASFSSIVDSAKYTFDPAAGNTVEIDFAAVTTRYVRIHVTANTGWPAAQFSEVEVYGSENGGGNPDPGTDPGEEPGDGTNLAAGKPIEASSATFNYVAANANDDNINTYWEGNGHPSTLTVDLGANANLSSVVIKLNPSSIWGTRTQTIQVLGREQGSATFTNLVSEAKYTFNPATKNTVKIPVSGTASSVQLRFTANSGAPGGQVAEFQVFGVPAANPDLTVTDLSWTPSNPRETDAVTLTATVKNIGTGPSPATDVGFYLNGTLAALPLSKRWTPARWRRYR